MVINRDRVIFSCNTKTEPTSEDPSCPCLRAEKSCYSVVVAAALGRGQWAAALVPQIYGLRWADGAPMVPRQSGAAAAPGCPSIVWDELTNG